ncbi:tRNA wybutosine-synthesizing 3 [Hyphodiscus hymeniophilus]|uniref:tRNA(Phe) 7-[(3-amino-3-carboxypropyl)-4-demethylwyosine(37)-N(4)]-methyltransferase n=1 Tax=Hyphodiscus hymeniophilus TaxID=353542 RepID=A0A9P6VQE4_9HELO|nr:tRNA wybutosine-synthesizing 3 [Hyphodiscus hymeniophilus]
MACSTTPLPQSFSSRKRKILEKLAVPASEYDDLSPKGSVDEGIRDLIDEINQIGGCVTTSSCAGRISIFLEGKKDTTIGFEEIEDNKDDEKVKTRAGIGGKGGGGKWLYVSHDPITTTKDEPLAEIFGMKRRNSDLLHGHVADEPGSGRWVHFKFEPMILHILTASLEQAQIVLAAALQSGFRESGALSLLASNSEPATPMVAVRSMGLALESIVGLKYDKDPECTVSEGHLKSLIDLANERFKENTIRIERFRALLKKLSVEGSGNVKRKGQNGEEWEDPQVRAERKKAEGLARSRQLKSSLLAEGVEGSETVDLQSLVENT